MGVSEKVKVHLHIWNTSTVHFYLSQSAVTSHSRELRVWICCAVFTNMYVRCFCERSVCAAELRSCIRDCGEEKCCHMTSVL